MSPRENSNKLTPTNKSLGKKFEFPVKEDETLIDGSLSKKSLEKLLLERTE